MNDELKSENLLKSEGRSEEKLRKLKAEANVLYKEMVTASNNFIKYSKEYAGKLKEVDDEIIKPFF